jgi:hypothetical protein
VARRAWAEERTFEEAGVAFGRRQAIIDCEQPVDLGAQRQVILAGGPQHRLALLGRHAGQLVEHRPRALELVICHLRILKSDKMTR